MKKGTKAKRKDGIKLRKLKTITLNNNDNEIYISRKIFGAVVGSAGSVQCQIRPCSGLYLLLVSTGAPQMHSLSLTAGF